MTMTREELNEKVELHRKWLENEDGGVKLNLSYADLRSANLRYADLSYADLRSANLRYADLRGADLRSANLRYADLSYADLRSANLRYADLRGADLDFSALPLWCGSFRMHIDDRIAVQLLYHVARTVLYSKHTSEELKRFCGSEEMLSWANRFRRVDECGKLPRDEAE